MGIHKWIAVVLGAFLLIGIGAMVFLPSEEKWNNSAQIKIGAGDDISGVLMDEVVERLAGTYQVSQTLESSSFQDCCSNTAQWALNAKEINIGFFCTHIAKHMIEQNEDVEIYGSVIMNGELIVYKDDWEQVTKVGVTQGREKLKTLASETYPQIEGFNEITQKGILYALEDEQIDAAILDLTKAAQVPDYENQAVSVNDYISYVLVVDKEFEETQAFADFIDSYNEGVEALNQSEYLAEILGVSEEWLLDKNVKFLTL